MRFLTASIVYPITSNPVKDGIVVIDENGTIRDVIDPAVTEFSGEVEKYDGILCPGFVNAHCHLELSHLNGRIESGRGLSGFIEEVVSKRNEPVDLILQKAKDADEEMYNNGIVSVGDISNSDITIETKKNSRIYYHTFVELFDFLPERAQTKFDEGLQLLQKYADNNLRCSLAPHAPYSVSEPLMKLIGDYAKKNNDIITIHNQETSSENEMFENGKGILLDQIRIMIPPFDRWKSPDKNSLSYILDELPSNIPLQLVHNTFTRKSDLSLTARRNLFWCLCTRANLYIENKLPDIEMLASSGCKMTVGTDSYASNHSLSIFDELKTIKENFPSIETNELLKWATLNGAELLGISDKYGSLEKGKQPGVVAFDWATGTKRIG